MTSDDVNWERLNDETIDGVIQTSFNTRLIIKEKLKELELESEMDHKCLNSVKNVFRALRYVEDYLIEIKEFSKTGCHPDQSEPCKRPRNCSRQRQRRQ
jgi:hypothetical protein